MSQHFSRKIILLKFTFSVFLSFFLFGYTIKPVSAASNLVNQWIKTIATDDYEDIADIVFDSTGNFYIAGHFGGTDIDFDPSGASDPHSSNGSTDIFLSKYASNGTYQWTITFGGAGIDYAYALAIDTSDNLYLGGSFNGTNVDFDGTGGSDLFTSSSSDMFITKYTAAGAYVWTRAFGGSSTEVVRGLATDGNTAVYATGVSSSAPADYDGTAGTDNISNGGSGNAFITKYNTDGTYGWTRTIFFASANYGWSVAVDSGHNVVGVGYFFGTNVDFDGTGGSDPHTSAGSYDIYITKYASNGNYVWSKTFGGTTSDQGGRYVILDSSDNIYSTGIFQSNNADFDASGATDTHASNGNNDVYVTKYLSDGSYGWTQTYGGTAADWGRALVINGTTLYTSANFRGTVDIDPTVGGTRTVTAIGDPDAVISAFDLDGNYLWSEVIANAGWDDPTVLAFKSNTLYVAGTYQGTNSDLDMMAGTSTFTSGAGDDFFFSTYIDASAPTATPTPTTAPTATPTPTMGGATATPTPTSAGSVAGIATVGIDPPACTLPAPSRAALISLIVSRSTSADIYLEPLSSGVTGYTIYYRSQSTQQSYAVTFDAPISTGSLMFTINDLQAGEIYQFQAQARNGCAAGPLGNLLSSSTTQTTSEPPISVEPPSGTITDEEIVLPTPTPNLDDNPIGEPASSAIFQLPLINQSVESWPPQSMVLVGVTILGAVSAFELLTPSVIPHVMLITMANGSWLAALLNMLLFPLGIFRYRKKSFGIVFDSVTSKPIAHALVMFHSASGNLQTTYTNQMGRFAIHSNPESYTVSVNSAGYTFPSKIITTPNNARFATIYQPGKPVVVSKEPFTNLAIPLDPNEIHWPQLHKLRHSIVRLLSNTARWLGIPFSLILFAISIIGFAQYQEVWLLVSAVFSGLFFLISILTLLSYRRNYGRLYHNNKPWFPASLELRRITNVGEEYYTSADTDERGAFIFVPENGEYHLYVNTLTGNQLLAKSIIVTDKNPAIALSFNV